ncbi:MAG: helix-turn-helix domain-containing protein [Stappiaceae bacterium]
MLKENRSLARGLFVLETLAKYRGMSLSEIHQETGLPKSTLRRLLATLMSKRFVRRSISDNRYRAIVTLPDISIEPVPPGLGLVVDMGLIHVTELTKKIGWPSDIQIFEGKWMRIIESTRSQSPFGLYRGQIDRRLNIFGAATGIACLSVMQEEEVRELFQDKSLEARFQPGRYALSWQGLQEHLNMARELGYGMRISNYCGETVLNDKLSAIALPLRRHEEIIGAISLLWPRELMSASDTAALYLEDLKKTVNDIEVDLNRFERPMAAE